MAYLTIVYILVAITICLIAYFEFVYQRISNTVKLVNKEEALCSNPPAIVPKSAISTVYATCVGMK